jgi:hypothetical protein
MNKRYALFSVPFVLLFLSYCTKDKGMLPKAAVINACDTITYTKHILPIMVNICYSCHGTGTSFAGTDKDWTVFANVKARADAGILRKRVIEANPSPMPPTGKLPQDQINLIDCWLQNGAKND